MKRRSFFRNLAAIIAAVAIAPEIAFRTKLELPKAEAISSFWFQTDRYSNCVSDAYIARMAELEAAGIVPVMVNNLHDFVMRKEASA